jgi:DNA-binding NarL/FixJ family response regulator
MAIRVAIVEDDQRIRNSLKVLLDGSPGFRCVATYGDAESALLDLPRESPDVVLMDINLPKMSGIECVRQLKERIPGILVIMLTVYEDSQKIFHSLQAGAVGYLIKSTVPSQILQAITEVHAGGSPMSAQIARKVVQSFYNPRADHSDTAKLTERELEILDLLAKGYLYKEIADQLSISRETVHNHLRRIYEKLHVRSRTEAVVKYFQR